MQTPDITIHSSTVGAFFDLDNTLIPGSAIEVLFFRHLWKKRLVGAAEASRSLRYLLQHIPPLSLHPLRERKLYLTGKRPSVIEPLAREFVQAAILPRLSAEGVKTLEEHRRAGHHVVLLTGSLDFLVDSLATHLKVDAVFAARPEQAEDAYTGGVMSPLPYGTGKLRLLADFAESRGVSLAHSYAYGDSPGDVEVLRAVGHPLVVNPIRGMKRIARRHGWPMSRWP